MTYHDEAETGGIDPARALQKQAEHEFQRLKARELAEHRMASEKAGRSLARTGRRTMADLVAQAVEEVEIRHDYGVVGLSTGISTLDARLGGVMQPCRVVGLAADTKSGKTTAAGNLVCAFALQGVPVLLGSFEDDPTDTVFRYIAGMTAGDVGVIRRGFRTLSGDKLPIPEDFDEGASALSVLPIEVMDRSGSIEQIAYEAKDWANARRADGHEFGVLVIDQLSHVLPSDPHAFAHRFPGYPPPPPASKKRELMVWQVQMLTRIAKKLNVLVIVLMQMTLSQTPLEKPSHHNLRDAKSAAFEMDALLIPWRPAKVKNTARGLGEPAHVDNTEDRAWILCPIARQVPSFELEVQWDGPGQRFLDLDADANAMSPAPPALSVHSLEGMRRLAQLSEKWGERAHARLEAANGGSAAELEQPELRQIGTAGAQWPAKAAKALPEPVVPAMQDPGTGFGGGQFLQF